MPSSEWERWNDEDDAAMQEAWLTMHDEEEPQTWQEWLLGESDGADEPWGCVLAQAIGYGLLLALVIGVMVVLAP